MADQASLSSEDPNHVGMERAIAVEKLYLQSGPRASAELLRQDFAKATDINGERILHAEEAKLQHDNPDNHALQHMGLIWAMDAEGKLPDDNWVLMDYWLPKQEASLNPFVSYIAQAAQEFNNVNMRNRSQYKVQAEEFEKERLSHPGIISDWQPALSINPNEVEDGLVGRMEVAFQDGDSKTGKEILQKVGECGSTSLNAKLRIYTGLGFPDLKVVDSGLADPSHVQLSLIHEWANPGGKGYASTDNSVNFSTAVVPICEK
jgi:hypothetical protein